MPGRMICAMSPAPLVSIVVPVHNDEGTIEAALASCLAQTLREIEVVCVDDASDDGTVAVIERMQRADNRIRLIRHEDNRSAFQSRRTGVLAAEADYILFVDGDDELVPDAARAALFPATASDADLVGFGVTVVERDGSTGGAYERRLQPKHSALQGSGVLRGLFPIDRPAQGQLWRHLFRTRILREAYELLPDDLSLARVNDLPLMFLVAALATRYASIDTKLYRYHFGRGTSGHGVDSLDRARFYTSAITAIDAVGPAVDDLVANEAVLDADLLVSTYRSARLSIIGYVCSQLVETSDAAILGAALQHLQAVASADDVIRAAARFYPDTLSTLRHHVARNGLERKPVRTILLVTATLRTGGVSAVLAAQARHLRAAGYAVIVVARSGGSVPTAIPSDVVFHELTSRDLRGQLREWADICRAHTVDVVIDHQILYSSSWPEFALVARAEGASTIGWLHNFVARPIYDGNSRLSLIERCSDTLAKLVVLSPLDHAYFSLRGVTHTCYLPNPPSSLLVDSLRRKEGKAAPIGRLELVWWGRLEQHTKRVYDLIDVAVHLRRNKIDFRLRVVGPDWGDITAAKFNARARRAGVAHHVRAIGPMQGQDLADVIDSAHVFVSTSIIEGFQLTIAEAQARGLPIVMYELPWLTLTQGNGGVVSVPQGEAAALAGAIASLAADRSRYEAVSTAAVAAAARALDDDFEDLYRALIEDDLPARFTPAATLDDARSLLGLFVFYAEHSRGRRGSESRAEGTARVRLWRLFAPVGRRALRRIPVLRPLAHRAKGWLGAR